MSVRITRLQAIAATEYHWESLVDFPFLLRMILLDVESDAGVASKNIDSISDGTR